MKSCFSLSLGLFLLLLVDRPSTIIASCQHRKCDQTAGTSTFFELLNLNVDFENGEIDPWIEHSDSGIKWKVENTTSPWEPENLAPPPLNGSNYLRVNRGATLSFGVAVLRSQTFTLGADTEVSFSFAFWIRSKWPQFTNLELYLAKNGNEALLLSLYEYSHVNNRVWQSQTVSLTDDTSSNLTLVFYAYCGTNAEDAVAIDDLRFISSQQFTSTTSVASTTSTETSSWTTATPVNSTITTISTYSSYETESTTYPSTTSTGTTLPTSSTTSTTSTTPTTPTTPTTSTSSNDFELTGNSTDPITSTTSTEPTETSTPVIITTSTTPLLTTSDSVTTDITEETTTGEQSTESTMTDAITTTTKPTTIIPEEEDCPSYLEGDTKVPCWILGGKCYCFFTYAAGKDRISANTFCENEDMALLSLETVEEDKLIYDHIKDTPTLNRFSYWTSGMYSSDGGKIWEWASTERFQPFTYVNWSPGEPDGNGPGYCVYLDLIKTYSAGYWSDLFCTNSFRFICESMN